MKRNITIIVAEDDDGHALLIKRNLIRSGVINPVIHFRNGEEVLAFFQNKQPEDLYTLNSSYVILLDIKMPKVDGIEVLEKLKNNIITKHIPIVMISTTDNPKEIDVCNAIGCNGFIIKPIDIQNLIDILGNLGYNLDIEEIKNPN